MSLLPTDPAAAAAWIAWVSLLLGLIVALIVTLLLWLIHRSTRLAHARVGDIWIAGQRVANNTIHIPALERTNDAVTKIVAEASRIEAAVARIEQHARTCPGCPQCLGRGP